MKRKLIIDGTAVYEVDEDCLLGRRRKKKKKRTEERNVYMEEYKKAMGRAE